MWISKIPLQHTVHQCCIKTPAAKIAELWQKTLNGNPIVVFDEDGARSRTELFLIKWFLQYYNICIYKIIICCLLLLRVFGKKLCLFLIPFFWYRKKPFKSKKGFAVFVVHLCLATSHSSPLHLFSSQHPEESLHVQQGEDGITTKQFILSADRSS